MNADYARQLLLEPLLLETLPYLIEVISLKLDVQNRFKAVRYKAVMEYAKFPRIPT